jgi:hypothetical protein
MVFYWERAIKTIQELIDGPKEVELEVEDLDDSGLTIKKEVESSSQFFI